MSPTRSPLSNPGGAYIIRKKPFENIVGKSENASDQHFALSPCFLSLPKQISIIFAFIYLCANAFKLDQSEIFSYGIGLNTEVLWKQQFNSLPDNKF